MTRNIRRKRGGMFGINVKKTLKENQRDYDRIWKHIINPETNKTYTPNDLWYWPGWTSKLMGETPHPNQQIPAGWEPSKINTVQRPNIEMKQDPIEHSSVENFLGTKSKVPEKYTAFIREWISIENIVTKKYDHARILDQPGDDCNKVPLEDCSANEKCVINTRSNGMRECIRKTRKTNFRKGTITGKTGLQFHVIESKYIVSDIDALYYAQYYYQVMRTDSNQRYVLFPTGRTNPVMDDPVIQLFLKNLADRLIQSNQSYCICGHSMGCVMSLNLGYLLHSINPQYFKEKIVVIGSAPYKWLTPDADFKNLENVLVFVYCQQYTSGTNTTARVDCFYLMGQSKHYSPYYMMYDHLYASSPRKDIYMVKYSDGEDIKNDFKNTIFMKSRLCDDIHSWENYYNAFIRLFPSTGGRRLRSKKMK